MPSVDQTTAPVSSVPKISLRDFVNRREEIKAELMSAASDIGFLCISSLCLRRGPT